MSNVIAFPTRAQPDAAARRSALLGVVAEARRGQDDVFWLKENAEALNILWACGVRLSPQALAVYVPFYEGLEERLRFFPQYYRFFLSMCLDLEDMGFEGRKGEALCHWVAQMGLAEAELSDLQRAEAQRLLARRGAAGPLETGALGDRLRQFAARSGTFALPNKKAAYELTHIVFYLSDYGRHDTGLDPVTVQSLENCGLVAYLDQNHDLLAEVCVALVCAGRRPHEIWCEAVGKAHRAIKGASSEAVRPSADGYHAYMVTGWAQHVRGEAAFEQLLSKDTPCLMPPPRPPSVLRSLSECLYDLGDARDGCWSGMRARIVPYLSPECRAILQQAEASSDQFDAFFSEFARPAG